MNNAAKFWIGVACKEHVVQVLKAYHGAMIIISHDADFLDEIGVNSYFKISGGYVSFSAR